MVKQMVGSFHYLFCNVVKRKHILISEPCLRITLFCEVVKSIWIDTQQFHSSCKYGADHILSNTCFSVP